MVVTGVRGGDGGDGNGVGISGGGGGDCFNGDCNE